VKKATVLIFALALLMMSAVVAPAMAIGPWEALEVGNNPNLWVALGALHNSRGEAVGVVVWTEISGVSLKWSFFDTVSGQGKANNAIVATLSTLAQFSADLNAYMNGEPTVNENKWIIMSPDGSGNQYFHPTYGWHGTIWWLFYIGSGSSSIASYVASLYPNGVYWMYNFIQ
jgi:hypothetical protein